MNLGVKLEQFADTSYFQSKCMISFHRFRTLKVSGKFLFYESKGSDLLLPNLTKGLQKHYGDMKYSFDLGARICINLLCLTGLVF